MQIENTLRNARVLEEEDIDTDIVGVGSHVSVEDVESGEDEHYLIVGSAEADPEQRRISDESPVGKALIGQKVGDTVSIKIPMGSVKYKIKAIERMA